MPDNIDRVGVMAAVPTAHAAVTNPPVHQSSKVLPPSRRPAQGLTSPKGQLQPLTAHSRNDGWTDFVRWINCDNASTGIRIPWFP